MIFIFTYLKILIKNIHYSKILRKIYKNEDMLQKLSFVLGTKFRIDKICRVYGVINPAIRDGKYNEDQIMEFGNMGLNNIEYTNQWIIQRLNILKNFIFANNLFELLESKIEKLDNSGNYLFIIQPLTLGYLINNLKKFSIRLIFLVIFSILLYIIIIKFI